MSRKGQRAFRDSGRRALQKEELHLGQQQLELSERCLALTEQQKAFHLETYTSEMVFLWRDADESTREGLAKSFFETTGKHLHTEVTQRITRVLQQRAAS
jgi:hypothetical protein